VLHVFVLPPWSSISDPGHSRVEQIGCQASFRTLDETASFSGPQTTYIALLTNYIPNDLQNQVLAIDSGLTDLDGFGGATRTHASDLALRA
jgi:hypothetical protein